MPTGVLADAKPSPKPSALLIAATKTLVMNATEDGKLKIGCNSFMEPVTILAGE